MKFSERLKSTNNLGWGTTLVGVLIMLTPTFLPVCQGLLELVNGKQVPMRCHWTAHAEMILGGVLIIVGIMQAFAQSAETKMRLANLVVVLGAVVILTPLYIIPTCMNPEMSCNVGTKPALIILGAIATVLGLIGSRGPKQEELAM